MKSPAAGFAITCQGTARARAEPSAIVIDTVGGVGVLAGRDVELCVPAPLLSPPPPHAVTAKKIGATSRPATADVRRVM